MSTVELTEQAKSRVEVRSRARRDKMFLATEILGYDFQECHRELFALYPDFDGSKPWDAQIEGRRDVMVLWPRGHYKSTAVKVVIIQAILNNPDISIIIMQGNIELTKLFLKEIRSHFTGEAHGSRLKEFFPEFCGEPGTRDLGAQPTLRLTVPCRKRVQTPQPTIAVASPRSIKTGQHYWLGVFDDLQNEANWRNPVQLKKVQEDFQGIQPLVQHGGRWVSGTRWTFGDLYEQIIRWDVTPGVERHWNISIKNCWTDGTELLANDKKEPRFPKFTRKDGQKDGFTRDDLLSLEAQDPAWFACQYLNRPIHVSKQHFTREMFIDNLVPLVDVPWLSQPTLMVDLASTDNVRSDDSVIACGQMDTLAKMWLTGLRGDQWTPMEVALNVIDMALKHRPVKIVFEKSAAATFFVDYLQMIAIQKRIMLPIEFVKIDTRPGAKGLRIAAMAGIVKRGQIKFVMGLPKFEKLIRQAVEFSPKIVRHDDYIDCLALLWDENAKRLMTTPMREPPKSPILAMVEDRERDLASQIVRPPEPELVTQDMTGFE